MKTYTVRFESISVYEFEVDAENEEQAREYAEELMPEHEDPKYLVDGRIGDWPDIEELETEEDSDDQERSGEKV